MSRPSWLHLLVVAVTLARASSGDTGNEGGCVAGDELRHGACRPSQQPDTVPRVRVAFLHHSLDMGGVERQMLSTWAAVDRERVAAEVVLFQDLGGWADKFKTAGLPVRLFRVFSSSRERTPASEAAEDALLSHLRGFDVVHAWYGGGPLGSFGAFATQAGARAGVPVVQNLAWNVFSVDLSVAVVVAECHQTLQLHAPHMGRRFGVTEALLRSLAVDDEAHQLAILNQG
ncbi:hypothetical protein T484DRAFT_1811556, partial [Baffinella frigidus]